MTIEEIRKGAPSGATHYHTKNTSAIYYKIVEGRFKFYVKKWDSWFGSNLFLDDSDIKPLN